MSKRIQITSQVGDNWILRYFLDSPARLRAKLWTLLYDFIRLVAEYNQLISDGDLKKTLVISWRKFTNQMQHKSNT